MEAEGPIGIPPRGRVPTPHVLRAALKAGSALDGSGTAVEVAYQSYLRLPTGGLYHSQDLLMGEWLLIECGLVRREADMLYPSQQLHHLLSLGEEDACELLLAAALNERPPLWLYAAVQGDAVSPELIPDDDTETLAEVIPSAARREALLLALGRRYDPTRNATLGNLGEELVMAESRAQLQAAGRPDLAEKVQRVSLISDQLGYDVIAPTLSGSSRRMEVKTTARAGGLIEVTIARNEALVGLRDPCWALVACRVGQSGAVHITGWCRGSALGSLLPTDKDPRGRWASAALTLLPDLLSPGLPPYD